MSAVAEIQHFLSQIPPQSITSKPTSLPFNNPIAIAHAALQHLRDSGDPTFLFFRSIVEITSDSSHSFNSLMDPNQQELLFHCVSGFRHVLLHRWRVLNATSMGQEFCGICRDYFLELGISRSSRVSKAVGMACLNASASFWKRAWDASIDSSSKISTGKSEDVNEAEDAVLTNKLHSLINMIRTSSPSLLQHRIADKNALFNHLQTVISFPIENVNDTTSIPKSIMACSFLSALIAEFAGTSRSTMSYYNLSLENHRQLSQTFQENYGLNQVLALVMSALGGSIQRIVQESNSNLLDLVASILSLLGDTLSWDFHGGNWNDAPFLSTTSTSTTLIRPPTKWRELIVNPDFLTALFSLYSSFQQISFDVPNTLRVKHTIRQLILILSSVTGKIFPSENAEIRKGYSGYLVEGTLNILSSILPSIQSNSQEHGLEVVDMCCIISRIISNFKLIVLSELNSFGNLITAISSVGCEILTRQLSECQRVEGDLEMIMDEGWEWREEAWNHLMEGSVILAENCANFVGSGINGEKMEQTLKTALATKFSAPLYTTYVKTRIEMLRIEEYFLTKNANEVDEVREQISELNLEEQLEATASLGRLNIPSAILCLTDIWGQISTRLHGLFESSTATVEVTPEAAALLEEACLLIKCLCHLLTDDNTGEIPLIPLAVVESCVNNETTTMIVNMIHSVVSLAEYHASRIAQYPDNPNLSPFLGKNLLWFFHRWVSSYILPPLTEYSNVGSTKSGILFVWSCNAGSDSATKTAITFCVTLCLHYYCYWPQETAVHRNATKMLVALAQRGVDCRRLAINTMPFEQLVALHAVTSGAWHGSSDAALDIAISNYKNICQNISRNLVRGYLRISCEGRGNVLQGLLSCCCDDDQKALMFYDCCLHSVQGSFSNFIQALREKKIDPQDIYAQEMASLGVFLHIGVCQNYHPDRIPIFLTAVLPNLSGLMTFYAEDLSICEALLHLFRDYAEQYISVLDPNCSLVLFQTSADLLKSYSTHHCASRVIRRGSTSSLQADAEEEQKFSDILSAIQLLIHLGTKDFIDVCNTENGSDGNTLLQVTDVIFFGLQQILPLMTQGLLHYPQLCSHYFSLVGFMMDTYPEKACALPYDLFRSLLESLLFGMSHADSSISKYSLRGIAEVAREHLKTGALQAHLSQHPDIFLNCSRRLLQEVIFQSIIWDRIEGAGIALLPLVAVNVQQFVALVNDISSNFDSKVKQERLQCAFERLIKPDMLSKVVSIGFEGRKNRIAFKKDFECFVKDVHSFLVVH